MGDEEEDDLLGTSVRGHINAVELSSDAYGHLVRATSDICSPRYHYYCDDGKAKLPDEIILVANTRPVPIKGNAYFPIGNANGAIEAEPVPDKSPGVVHFVPAKGRSAEQEMARWRTGFQNDLKKIQEVRPEAQYVCMPELGFPYGLNHQAEMVLPRGVDSDWDWLQDSKFLIERFVCLGSSHRTFLRSDSSDHYQYENVAIVFPSGQDKSKEAEDVFNAKLKSLEDLPQIEGVTLMTQVESGIAANFTDERVLATRRQDLSSRKVAKIDRDKIQHAKKAFDFYSATGAASRPPLYIKKKSPARKLGEYIDAEGKIELDVFVTELGVTAVLICYDAFDPSIFLSAVRMYYESLSRRGDFYHQGIDIFFIPAFNRSQKFVDMCEVLSRETNSIVVYVSGDERCEVKSNVFICGQSCELWAETMAPGQPPDLYFEREEVEDFKHLHIYRISGEVVTAARRALRSQASPSVRKSKILRDKRLGAGVLA